MDRDKALEIQQALIFLFEREFKLGRAMISYTGGIRFESEQIYGKYYQLYETLKGSYPDIAEAMLKFLRKSYMSRTVDDFDNYDSLPKKSVKGKKSSGEELLEAIRNVVVEYED